MGETLEFPLPKAVTAGRGRAAETDFVDNATEEQEQARKEAELLAMVENGQVEEVSDSNYPEARLDQDWQTEIDQLQGAVDKANADLAEARIKFPAGPYTKWLSLKKMIETAGADDPHIPNMKAALMELPNDEVMIQGAKMLKAKIDALDNAKAALTGAQKQKDFSKGALAA